MWQIINSKWSVAISLIIAIEQTLFHMKSHAFIRTSLDIILDHAEGDQQDKIGEIEVAGQLDSCKPDRRKQATKSDRPADYVKEAAKNVIGENLRVSTPHRSYQHPVTQGYSWQCSRVVSVSSYRPALPRFDSR
ncbi:unnamed protein product [Protopolystoma xenopodis]|uniref:Uncharacterized protein n=1 Tax=Protopolystoma xenopodis TaxID=117903 RepID=A0A3S5CPV0_9PLAT|nr:unnamed protein product [Protopolystoma xenopodis]